MANFDADAVDEEEGGKKGKGKIIGIALAAVVVIGGAAFALMSGPTKLSPEEVAVFEEAQKQLRTDDYKNYAEAEKKLLSIVEKHPGNMDPMVWLIQLYCAWGESLQNEAVAFKKASEANVKQLGDLKKTIEASKSKSKREAAQKDYDKAKEALAEFNKAYNLKDQESVGRFKEAKKWVSMASKTDYDDAPLHRAMADYGRITEKWSDVESHLKYVEKHKPSSAGLRFITGGMLMQKDSKYDEAVKSFDEALKVDPAFTKAQFFKALAMDKKGDSAAAAAEMKKVLEMSPNHPGARAFLGMVDTLAAAHAAAQDAEKAGTEKEEVKPGDEATPPAEGAKKE